MPVRSALFGTALAVVIVAATLTFGSGLDTLSPIPPSTAGTGATPSTSNYLVPPQSWKLFDKDPDVVAWSGVDFANAQIDGLTVPILLAGTHASVTPPMLSGHPLEANNQIVLGAATLAELHKRRRRVRHGVLRIAEGRPRLRPPDEAAHRRDGDAARHRVSAQTLHTSMGTGAMIPVGIEPLAFRKFLSQPQPDPERPGHGPRPPPARREPGRSAGEPGPDRRGREQGLPRRSGRWRGGGRRDR